MPPTINKSLFMATSARDSSNPLASRQIPEIECRTSGRSRNRATQVHLETADFACLVKASDGQAQSLSGKVLAKCSAEPDCYIEPAEGVHTMSERSESAMRISTAEAGPDDNTLRSQEQHVRTWKCERCDNVWELDFEAGVPQECPRRYRPWLHLLVASRHRPGSIRE